MTTFGEFKSKVVRAMGDDVKLDSNDEPIDPIGGIALSAEYLTDACHAALKAISIKQWKSSVFVVEEVGSEFELPEDLLEIDAVLEVGSTAYLPRLSFTIGDPSATLLTQSNSWTDTPHGSITFSSELEASGAKIYYLATWALPEDDDEELESPEICLTALILYAASYCYLRLAAEQAELAQFKTRIDSGQPVDLPAAEMSERLLRRFEHELNNIPTKQRATQ